MAELFGRQAPLAVLDTAIDDARSGRGRLVVISGEAGIGKSRLAQEGLDHAAGSGLAVARGYALDDRGAPPMWPWTLIGRQMIGVAAALEDGAATSGNASARFGAFQAAVDALTVAAADGGLVILLEDMHWADRATVDLLRHLCADLGRQPIVVLATARDTTPETPWAAALPDLLRGSATKMVMLDGLSPEAVTRWLDSSADLAGWRDHTDLLCASTRGNPFYLGLVTAVPPDDGDVDVLAATLRRRADLRGVMTARLSVLSLRCRRTVETVALLGELTTPALLTEITRSSPSDIRSHLSQAVSVGVLRESSTGPAFVHALVRDAVIAELSVDRLAELHRDIAVALEAAGDPGLATMIAEHWQHAAGPEAAERCLWWSRRAAAAAAAVYADDRAIVFARLALDRAVAAGVAAGDLAAIMVELARYQFADGQLREALSSCLAAAEQAELAEQVDRADLLAASALVIHGVGSGEILRVVGGLCRRALAALPGDDTALRARVLAQLAVTEAESGGGRRGAELAAESVAAARRSGDRDAELEALAARHLTITTPGQVDEREQLAHRAIDLGRTASSPMAALWGHLWLVDVAFQRGDLSSIDGELAEIHRIAVDRRFPLARWHWYRIRAARATLLGFFADAEQDNDSSLELAVRLGEMSMIGVYHAFIVMVAAMRGENSGLTNDVVAVFRSAPPFPLVRTLLLLVLLLRDEQSEAAAVFDELRPQLDELEEGPRWAGTVGLIGIAAVLVQDQDIAERCYQRLLPGANYCDGDGSGVIFSSGSIARPLADLALTAGRVDEAVALYADAVIANTRLGARPFVALSRLGWAQALRTRAVDRSLVALRSLQDLRLAADLARQAAADFRRLGMPVRLQAADRLLARLASDIANDNPLTARETEVAVLLGMGMSNRAVAARLVVSERTVESHVRNILTKLDLRSRAEVAGWFSGRR